jgi:hypothetical protein
MNACADVLALCAQHNEADPDRLIVRLCRELLDQCPTSAGPTPLKILGSLRGVRRYYSRPIHPATGCSGLLVPYDGGYEITVHGGEPAERQHFSIAHEVVHTYFREACPDCPASPEQERLCDLGAAELTMPSTRFAATISKLGLTLASIDHVAAEFGVSFEAAARRAVILTEDPACMLAATISTGAAESPTPAELRIVKSWHSPAWRRERVDYRGLAIDPDSVIAQAFRHQDERQARADIGIVACPGVHKVQARGYAYPLPGNPAHRQVVAIVSSITTASRHGRQELRPRLGCHRQAG